MDMFVYGVFLLCGCLQITLALRIGNYPFTRLNRTLLPRERQLDIYARIFDQYDLTALTNIVDKADLEEVSEILKQGNRNYEIYISPLLKHLWSPWPENYGVFYRSDLVSVSDFIRDQATGAFSMRIRVKGTGQEFVLSLLHLNSRDVINQLELLPETFDRLQSFYNLENVLFVGDFNTFSDFSTEESVGNTRVSRDPLYQWFIDYTANAVFPVLPNIYGAAQRFLARGNIRNWVVPDSAGIFDIMEFFNLTLLEAAGVGNFLPVHLELMEPIKRP